MKSSIILSGLATTTLALNANKVYIATSSEEALVNQWAVVTPDNMSRVTFTSDPNAASTFTVAQDPAYAGQAGPFGSVLMDIASNHYAFGFQSDDDPSGYSGVLPVHFEDHQVADGDYGYIVLPMVNNIVQSLELRAVWADMMNVDQTNTADKIQVCGTGEERYLALATEYEPSCQNVTLKYV